MTLDEKDFIRLVTFIQRNYGIDLRQKRQLVEGRLATSISNKGFINFTSYVDFITTKADKMDIDFMLNKLTTNYTFFMREELHFEYLTNTVLPYLVKQKRNKVLNIWSAGCSSGQEPYTISIVLKEFFKGSASEWDTRVLATDISQNVLAQAKKGVYQGDSIASLPDEWKTKYFDVNAGKTQYAVKDALKKNVIFKTFNLMDQIQFKTKFDVIFCRNVMIYFDTPTKDALVERFYDATVPGGYLFIGHSETVNKTTTRYQYLQPAMYRRRP